MNSKMKAAQARTISGCKCFRLPAGKCNQQLERFAHRYFVVNHKDRLCCDPAAADIISVQMLKYSTRLQRGVKCLQEICRLKRLEQAVHCALGD